MFDLCDIYLSLLVNILVWKYIEFLIIGLEICDVNFKK